MKKKLKKLLNDLREELDSLNNENTTYDRIEDESYRNGKISMLSIVIEELEELLA